MSEKKSKQRYTAPLFFLLAAVTIGLAIAQVVRHRPWIAVIADFVIAAVFIAMGLRVLNPKTGPGPVSRPLRAPRPPR